MLDVIHLYILFYDLLFVACWRLGTSTVEVAEKEYAKQYFFY